MRDHPVLSAWLDRLKAFDVEGMACLYRHDACLDTTTESFAGRTEIAEGLTTYRKYLQDLTVETLENIRAETDRIRFSTTVRGLLGRAMVEHDWDLQGDVITRHQVRVQRLT